MGLCCLQARASVAPVRTGPLKLPRLPVLQGWLLDGIPQTRLQALGLQEAGIIPQHVGESRRPPRPPDVPHLTAVFGQWCWTLLMMCCCRGVEANWWTH